MSPEAEAAEEGEQQADLSEDDLADAPSEGDVASAELDESAIAEQVAEETNQDQADDQEEQGDETASDPEEIQEVAESVAEGDLSIGHVYCRSLGLGAAVLVTRYDEDLEEPREDLVDEYAALAKQTDLDHYMDQWFEQSMGRSEMTPAQGVAVGTVMFAVGIAVHNPAVAEGLAQEVGL